MEKSSIVETLDVGGRRYSTMPVPPSMALGIHADVLSVFGSQLGGVLATHDLDMDNERSMVSLVVSLVAGCKSDRLPGLVQRVLSEVQTEQGKLGPGLFDAHFSQYPMDIYPVFAWALVLNIRPFFENSGDGWRTLLNMTGSLSPRTGETSTGSGDQSGKG